MSNEDKFRTKKVILDEIKNVKDKIKPQFEAVENYIHNVRPTLVEEKQALDIKLEQSKYTTDDISRLFDLHTELYEKQPRINYTDEQELIKLYKELANFDSTKGTKGGKRRKTKGKSLKKKKSKTMKKKAKKSMKKSKTMRKPRK
tara:strand:+ start:86 stop:520 length:435 start_codon:yes stop_codon:yes gene_type:complete